MCDYCGCREQPSIARFSEEHDRIEVVAASLLHAHTRGSRSAAQRIAAQLLSLLAPHVAREERLLFPELDASGAGAHTQRLEGEHRDLETALEPIADGIASPAQWDALPQVLAELRRHIWTEEFDVFPAALQLLAPDAWQRVESGSAADVAAEAAPPTSDRGQPDHRRATALAAAVFSDAGIS